MRIDLNMDLYDRDSGNIVLRRQLTATNSYNQLASQYTTNVSNQYARERALDEIARQTEIQLALFFKRGGDRNNTINDAPLGGGGYDNLPQNTYSEDDFYEDLLDD